MPFAMRPQLTVELFGGVRVARDGEQVDLTHSSQVLLGCLALQRAHRASRPLLIELIAPDQPPDFARRRLNTAVWRLRRSLEPDHKPRDTVLRADPGGLMISPECDVWVDALEFERVCERHRSSRIHWTSDDARDITAAVARYQGELLPGVDFEWAVHWRQRCADLYLSSLVGLAQWHRRDGETAVALHLIDTALGLDPTNERIHRIAMTMYFEAGLHELVERQFDRCVENLTSIDVRPSEETLALRRRLVDGRKPTQVSPPVEVGEVLADITAALAEVRRIALRLERMAAHLRRPPDGV